MIRAIIADDEPLARDGLLRCLANVPDLKVVAVCADGLEAVEAIATERPDLALLDIRMPGLDGFDVVDAIGSEKMPALIFVTAYEEYAVRAFEESAVDYVLKPIAPERVARAVARARERIADEHGDEARRRLSELLDRLEPHRPVLRRVAVPTEKGVDFVPAHDILWIESDRNYARLHTGDATHRIRATLSGLDTRLGRDFARIHRSLLVRVDRIRSLEPLGQGDYVVVLDTGTRLTSSRSYREDLRGLLEGVSG